MSDTQPGREPSAGDGSGSASRGHRRAAAREKAQRARKRQKRRARGGRWAIQGGIGIVVIAAIVAIVLGVRGSQAPTGPGPANMAGDGITIGKNFDAVKSGPSSTEPAASGSATPATGDTVDIVVYLDYLCPICGSFEKTNNTYIKGLVKSGAATVSYHPIAILTNQSLGTKYSQRAANAAACVANYSPDAYFDFNAAMFAQQPEEGTQGLTDKQLVSLIDGVDGMTHTGRIASCVTSGTYQSWVVDATQRALSGPLPGTKLSKIGGTPTVLVNGQQYKYTTPFTVDEFSNFVVTAAGNSYASNPTETPVPTPSGTPVPGNVKKGTPAPN